jgi:hypothetical protein
MVPNNLVSQTKKSSTQNQANNYYRLKTGVNGNGYSSAASLSGLEIPNEFSIFSMEVVGN